MLLKWTAHKVNVAEHAKSRNKCEVLNSVFSSKESIQLPFLVKFHHISVSILFYSITYIEAILEAEVYLAWNPSFIVADDIFCTLNDQLQSNERLKFH